MPDALLYAYMQWEGGKFKLTLPAQFLEFIHFIRVRAHGRPIIGWGYSRGAKWLVEIVREHKNLLHAAVMFAGYPQTKCQYEQQASVRDLIAAKDCAICMVHFVADSVCGVQCFPHWHAEFVRHMETPRSDVSCFVSVTMPGTHDDAYPIWCHWEVDRCEVLKVWFDLMWDNSVAAR